jgi:hypothetical protein
VEPGADVTVQPFALTITRAAAVDDIEGMVSPLTAGSHLMMVLLDAENLSKESVGTYLLSPVSREDSYRNRNLVVLDDRLRPENPSVYDAESKAAISSTVTCVVGMAADTRSALRPGCMSSRPI